MADVPDIPHAVQFARYFDHEWQQELKQIKTALTRIANGDEPDATDEDARLIQLRLNLHTAMIETEAA